MNLPELRTWIGGIAEESPVEDGWLVDPNTGERLQRSRASSLEQVDRAIAAAHEAHRSGEWLALGVEGRGQVLERVAELLDAQATEIARLDALNSGVSIRVTTLMASGLGATFRRAVATARELGQDVALDAPQGTVTVRPVPWGVTALILPWNAPAATAATKIAFALAAGATVVVKPSPASPSSAQLILAALIEAGLPEGVANLVLGGADVGERLTADTRVRAISLTGSTATGRSIAEKTAGRMTRLRMELGSNNPAIVRADADLEVTARELVSGFTKLNGQWCEAPREVYVARPLVAPLIERIRERAGDLVLGSSVDSSTDIGPMAFEARREALEAQREQLRAGGAQVEELLDAPDQGAFFAPTLVTGEGLKLGDDEVFGPMMLIIPVDSDEEALAAANDGQLGLAAYVFSADEAAAFALGGRLEAGEVKINGTSVLRLAPGTRQSFFGNSGIGAHGDADTFEFHVGHRVIGKDLIDPPL